MSISDPISDAITRIRNGMAANKSSVLIPASKVVVAILDVLKREGYIVSYEVLEVSKNIKDIKVELKYHDGNPVIKEINRISKPGRRVYSEISELKLYYNGLGISVLSTSKGVLSDNEARQHNVGGEVLCQVF